MDWACLADQRRTAFRFWALAIASATLAAFRRAAVGANILPARMIVSIFAGAIKALDGVAVFVLAVQTHPSAALAALKARVL